MESDVTSTLYSMQARVRTVSGWCVLALGGKGHFLGDCRNSERSRAPHTQARGSRAWHNSSRHGEMPDFSDEQALRPIGGPELQSPPATPTPGVAQAPTARPGSQTPATMLAGVAGEPAPLRTSPVMETVTALGYRRVIDPCEKLSAADITLDLAPAVMVGLWRRLGNLDMSPLAETVYQEYPAKKEQVS